MADNTYGGQTLHEMKDVLKVHEKSTRSHSPGQQSPSDSLSGSQVPSSCPLPGMAPRSPSKGKKPLPLPQPKAKKLSLPESRVPPYVNVTGHSGNVPPPPPDYPPPGHQNSDPEDEQEDEYIAPSQLIGDPAEGESNQIYQNLHSNGVAEPSHYLNVGFGEGEALTESPSLYQNVNFSSGKAKPKVQPRVPKKPHTHH